MEKTEPMQSALPPSGTMTLQFVAPEYAKMLLTMNTHNRPLNRQRVHEFADIIKRDAWRTTTDAFTVSSEGVLLTGQTRLWGIVEAGIGVWAWVATGVDPNIREAINQGARESGEES